jgi:galactokinase
MTGGGFGGSVIAVIRSGRAELVAGAVQRAFAKAGFTTPAFLSATPSAPAGRVNW